MIWLFHSQRPICQKCFPSKPSRDGLVNEFEQVMTLTEDASPNGKRLKKLFKNQLIELLVEKEMIEVKMENQNRALIQLHMQLRDKEVFIILIFWIFFFPMKILTIFNVQMNFQKNILSVHFF